MKINMLEKYKVSDTSRLASPSILLFPEQVKKNIERLKSQVMDVAYLRPHIKTIKSKPLIQLLLDAGIRKFKCATLKEARLLGELGAPDVLIAYPLVAFQIQLYLQLIKDYPQTKFQAIIESHDAAAALQAELLAEGIIIDLFIDVNLGMCRTGVEIDNLADFYTRLQNFQNLNIVGFHGYDGHIRESRIAQRMDIIKATYDRFLIEMKSIEEYNGVKLKRVFGGSNTFPFYARQAFVECSPGTFMLWDWGYHLSLPEQDFDFAALLFSRVVSKPSRNTICLDLGYKSVASESPLDQRFHIIGHANWIPLFQSEEHLVLQIPDAEMDAVHIADELYIIPYHICPTVAWYPYYQVISDGLLSDVWTIEARY